MFALHAQPYDLQEEVTDLKLRLCDGHALLAKATTPRYTNSHYTHIHVYGNLCRSPDMVSTFLLKS